MTLLSTDLVPYLSQNAPVDDVSSNGGAINPLIRATFVDVITGTTVQAFSSSTADVGQSLTVTARRTDGSQAAQTLTLTGQVPVVFSSLGALDRVQSAILSSTTVGNVTVERTTGVLISVIPAGELGFSRLFQQAISSPTATKIYYMKIFFKNNNPTNALLTPTVTSNAAPGSGLAFALAPAIDDAGTSPNRLTAPSSLAAPGTFDTISKNMPQGVTTLGAGHAIGVWIQLTLAANNPPVQAAAQLQLIGSGV